MKTLKVKDIMYAKVFSVTNKASVLDAAVKMKEEKVGSILVKQGGEYVGIVTTKDITHKVTATEKNADETKVTGIMSSPIIMIEDDLPIHEAVNLMTQYGIKRLVVSKNDKVTGVISARLILKFINSV